MNELYDLKNDPGEEFNLYKNPAYNQQLAMMKIELNKNFQKLITNKTL
jgi:hypothetical protein